jgi:hypothetical protein
MKTGRVLAVFVVAAAAFAFIHGVHIARGLPQPSHLQVVSSLVFGTLTFLWFWIDSELRSFKRSPLLSVAIVALAVIAVPYYLMRSRVEGERLLAFVKLIFFVVTLYIAIMMGGTSGAAYG